MFTSRPLMQYYCIMDYTAYAEAALRHGDFRITAPRLQVISALAEARAPLSPYEIQSKLARRGIQLNHVTIYRVLDLLCILNLAHHISTGGYVKCTLEDQKGCHGHMICSACGTVAEFSDSALCTVEEAIADRLGFQAEHRVTELSGLCAACTVSTGGEAE